MEKVVSASDSSDDEPLSVLQTKLQHSSDNVGCHLPNPWWENYFSDNDIRPTKIVPLSRIFPSETEDNLTEKDQTDFSHENVQHSDTNITDDEDSVDEFIPTKQLVNESDSDSMLSFLEENETSSDETDNIPLKEVALKQQEFSKRDRENIDSSSDSDTALSEIAKAMKQSLKEKRRQKTFLAIHRRRLDVLIKSNGLQRQDIAKNGNCFFEAISTQLKKSKTHQTLRKEACEHLEQFKEHYIEYLELSDASQTNRDAEYHSQVQFLKENGHWSTDLADILPMAVSNMYGTSVRIYTSRPTQPIVDVQPSLAVAHSDDKFILAYCSLLGMEHYDTCVTLSTEYAQHRTNVSLSACEVTPKKGKSEPKSLKQITPRKQAMFSTPPKKLLTRKHKLKPENWKKNIRKNKRQKGQEYVSTTGKIVKKRNLQEQDCSKCRFQCSSHISEEERQELFNSYWNLQSHDRQRDFICEHVLQRKTTGFSDKKRKQVAREFNFHIKGQSTKVCKRFFLATLNIGKKTVDCALKKKVSGSIFDRRGCKSPHNKTPETDKALVRQHIESFPTVESHYTRTDSKRKYLSSDLTINKMYSLYREEKMKNQQRLVSANVYRNIFCKEYNLSFHTPKKDQCNICNEYSQKEALGTADVNLKYKYQQHQQRKLEARNEKEMDKKKAKHDKKFHVATFDMESVLTTPCSLVNQAYYKRKLCCYNLSVYSLGDMKGQCYLWNETEGKRGSCEVGSCILLYLSSLPKEVEHVSLFSDTCGGQNKNKFITTALLYSVSSSATIKTIDQKFLEPGHTQMECDSMHSAIEFAKKRTSIFVPSQWDTVVHMARRSNPYTVIPMKHWDFYDLKILSKSYITNTQFDDKGQRVLWKDIKHMQLSKEQPGIIKFKTSFRETTFRTMKCPPATRRQQRAIDDLPLPKRYTERLPITEVKKKDLLCLCSSHIIPEDYWQFYEMLPTSKKIKDKLPEPDVMEDNIDTDD